MTYRFSDYRHYLKVSLEERVARNRGYSLRAFAKGLGLSPAMLSMIQNRKRNLTPNHALRVAKKLGLNARESDYFALLVQFEAAKSTEARELISERLNQFVRSRKVTMASLDSFNLISEWFHLPILQMLELQNFPFQPAQIARRLGISAYEAAEALERLVRMGILSQEGDKWIRLQKNLRFESPQKNLALRSFHRQMLQKAADSLDTQTPDEKCVGSETIAIDVKQLPQARKLINEFFDQMNALLENSATADEVYHLGVQFFRLTEVEK